MIFGSYPCCNGALCLAMPDKTPAYLPEDCPHCGAKVWHLLSRVAPMSYTEADFLAEFDVDEAAKTIQIRDPELLKRVRSDMDAGTSWLDALQAEFVDGFTEAMADRIRSGLVPSKEKAGE